MEKEYLIISAKSKQITEILNQLGLNYQEIKAKCNYYLVDVPAEKFKAIYSSGLEIVAKFSEIPEDISKFKDKFKSTINDILEKDNLPGIDSIAGYRPLCAKGPAYSREDILNRDLFLEKIYQGLRKVKTAKA